MRISLLLIMALGFLTLNPGAAEAGGRGQQPDGASACSDLKGGTKGLYGICVAYCSVRDQSHVDLNDIASVKRAAASLALWDKYDAKRQTGDPDMPCHRNGGSDATDDSGSSTGTDTSGGDSGSDGSDDGTVPPPPAQCPCWTGADLASIEGDLPVVDGWEPMIDCTTLEQDGAMYQEQVSEGYNIGFLTTVEGVAWASTDGGGQEPYNGCFFSDTSGALNFELERAQADQCVQEVATHCALLGNP